MSSKAMRDRYEGQFLEGADLMAKDAFALKIVSVADPGTIRDSRKKVIEEAVIEFAKAKKKLVLGKTNYRILVSLFGTDETLWIGKTVQLQCRFLDCFGELDVPCVRIVPPHGTPIPKGARDYMGTFQPQHGPKVTRGAALEPAKKRSPKKEKPKEDPPEELSAYEFAMGLISEAPDRDALDQIMSELEVEPWSEDERVGLQRQFTERCERK